MKNGSSFQRNLADGLISHSKALWPGWFLADVFQAVGPQSVSSSHDGDNQPKGFAQPCHAVMV